MTTPKCQNLKKSKFVKEYDAIAKGSAKKAYVRYCLDEEEGLEDEIYDCIEERNKVKYLSMS